MDSRCFVSLVAVSLLLLSGCATTNGSWGQQVTLTPGWDRIRDSAVNAALDPLTWVPLLGAAVYTIDDYDQKTVDWATRNTPLFGNTNDAEDASDQLRTLSYANALVTALVVPSGSGSDALKNKAKGIAAGAAVIGINDFVTSSLKSATSRQRPDRDSDNSFPSQHTSTATAAATLAARNIDHMPLSTTPKTIWKVGTYGVAALTGWARVEAGRHYPSDVLVGFALGHFLGAFLNDAFITPNAQDEISISVDVSPGQGAMLTLNYRL